MKGFVPERKKGGKKTSPSEGTEVKGSRVEIHCGSQETNKRKTEEGDRTKVREGGFSGSSSRKNRHSVGGKGRTCRSAKKRRATVGGQQTGKTGVHESRKKCWKKGGGEGLRGIHENRRRQKKKKSQNWGSFKNRSSGKKDDKFHHGRQLEGSEVSKKGTRFRGNRMFCWEKRSCEFPARGFWTKTRLEWGTKTLSDCRKDESPNLTEGVEGKRGEESRGKEPLGGNQKEGGRVNQLFVRQNCGVSLRGW